MDETYIKVKGKWVCLYRAVDKHGQTLDFMLSETRDEAAATEFFARAIANNGWPSKYEHAADPARLDLADRGAAGEIS